MEKRYVLITPMYNKEDYIEKTIKSVAAQTVLPIRWMIVDDGSTDGTSDILRQCHAEHDFMTSLRLERKDIVSYYAHRTLAFSDGYEEIKNLEYEFLGSLTCIRCVLHN